MSSPTTPMVENGTVFVPLETNKSIPFLIKFLVSYLPNYLFCEAGCVDTCGDWENAAFIDSDE